MLRRIDTVLTLLENPNSRITERTPSEEPQEEVTPVFEARVVVPGNSMTEPLEEVFTAVHDTLVNATGV